MRLPLNLIACERWNTVVRTEIISAIVAVALAVLVAPAAKAAHSSPAHPAGMPADVVKLSECIPAMGSHYAALKNMPLGPIYGYYNGKLVFSEVMIAQRDFIAGKSWDGALRPLPGHQIDHVDIWFNPKGHEGYWVPHYDIHAFYVPHQEHMFYCNPSSRRAIFFQGPHGEGESRPAKPSETPIVVPYPG
jgi:hypothetical protein